MLKGNKEKVRKERGNLNGKRRRMMG